MNRIEKARKKLEQLWDSCGDCGSCGWHGALYEHWVEDCDIEFALDENNGVLELSCVNKDEPDDRYSHRGVKIDLSEPEPFHIAEPFPGDEK